MRLGNVPHINPQRNRRHLGDLLLPAALQKIHKAAIRGVDPLKRREVRRHGADDQGRVHGDEVEAGLGLGDKVPGGLLGERLGDAVGCGGGRVDVVDGARVPGLLRVGCVGVREAGLGEDGGKGGCYDDAGDVRC